MTDRLRLLYLVHDLADPAVRRRIQLLNTGGALVTVAGFRRTDAIPDDIGATAVIDLGRTYNGGFLQRIIAVLRVIFGIHCWRKDFRNCDVVIARNLEMLAIAVRGRSAATPLVYESLDIHRLLLRPDMIGRSLRTLEGWLSRRASLLITSSPAFVREYFEPRSQVRLPVLLLENKVFQPGVPVTVSRTARPVGPPWKIGWFGAIRCRQSLVMLRELVSRSGGRVEVLIRGRPALDAIPDFDVLVNDLPGLRFAGPYRNPEDLERIYGDVHFTWAIDRFEQGLNSSWLLPNRLYEGGRHASVPLAEAGVEIGRWLQTFGLGVTFAELNADSLLGFFNQLTSSSYQKLFETATNMPAATFSHTVQDCEALVGQLRSLKGSDA